MTTLGSLLAGARRLPKNGDTGLWTKNGKIETLDLWCAGDMRLVKETCVAVVGSRKVSDMGKKRAARLGRELAERGIVVVSGLALGVDTAALTAAMEAGGRTIGVIGTSINEAYPRQSRKLHEAIYSENLLISQFHPNRPIMKRNWPDRNRLMAIISDATVIIEAKDKSGSLHQAIECARLKKWLFLTKSLVNASGVSWPKRFLDYPKTRILTKTQDILDILRVE